MPPVTKTNTVVTAVAYDSVELKSILARKAECERTLAILKIRYANVLQEIRCFQRESRDCDRMMLSTIESLVSKIPVDFNL